MRGKYVEVILPVQCSIFPRASFLYEPIPYAITHCHLGLFTTIELQTPFKGTFAYTILGLVVQY